MELRTALSRAKRAFRDDLRLHLVAIASLVIAFLCLGAALISVANLSKIAERWSEAQHLTVYLRSDAADNDIAQLRLVLESLREVKAVTHVTAEQAKQEFAEQVELGVGAANLPSDAFPASLEVALLPGIAHDRIAEIAGRVKRLGAVEEVETYREWFDQLGTLLNAGKSAVALLAVLVAICVLAVIGNTIRLAVANRRREIEVLKLCGATDSFVRGPFVLEGVMQASASAFVALLLLMIAFFVMRSQVEETVSAITGVRAVFLPPWVAMAMVVGGAAVGAIGSGLSLRRYLSI